MGTRERTDQVSVGGDVSLGDLRWLIDQCEGYADTSPVIIQAPRDYGPRDFEPGKIIVHGKL